MIVWIRILDEALNEAVITGMAIIGNNNMLSFIYTECLMSSPESVYIYRMIFPAARVSTNFFF